MKDERALVEKVARRLGYFRMGEWSAMRAGAREPYRRHARTLIALIRKHDRQAISRIDIRIPKSIRDNDRRINP